MRQEKETLRRESLLRKLMTQFIGCVAILFALAAPLFYGLTKNYYAEDMEDLIEAVQAGEAIPANDLEEDVMAGIMLQYLLITAMLGIGVVLTMRFLSKKLWMPFDKTLNTIDSFRLEDGSTPTLPDSDIKEFARLNATLQRLMNNSLATYHAQKEFTENASHELQTPLAIFQSKLDIFLQQPELTQKQAEIVQDLYGMTSRLSHLNRNLLLLAKIDNAQFDKTERIQLNAFLDEQLAYLDCLSGELRISRQFSPAPVYVKANRPLLESMVNNLVVNAVRHNQTNGTISITADNERLTISNTSDEAPLDPTHIFNRFYRPSQNKQGNGLGLAIVKAICDYHGWKIGYKYTEGWHHFIVTF